jgi:hypothetical protein
MILTSRGSGSLNFYAYVAWIRIFLGVVWLPTLMSQAINDGILGLLALEDLLLLHPASNLPLPTAVDIPHHLRGRLPGLEQRQEPQRRIPPRRAHGWNGGKRDFH